MSGQEAGSSGTELTPEQSKSLTVEGTSVALSAGAGCGKTFVLTARFLRDLDGPNRLPLRSIVTLTFTEKAARELRGRIRKECRERLSRGEGTAHWRSILRGLEAAPIGTFHQFCGQLLRRHAIEAGIDPEFAVLDATIAKTVRDEALAACLRDLLALGDPDLIDLAVEFGLNRVREALAALVSHRDAGRFEEWAARSVDAIFAIWVDAWEREVRLPCFRKVVSEARRCADLIVRNACSYAKIAENLTFLREHLPDIEAEGHEAGWIGAVRDHITAIKKATRKNHWSSVDVYETVRAGLDALRDAIDELRDASEWDESISREAAAHGLRYMRLALKARTAYEAAKRERGALDFDDLLVKTRDLLRADPARVLSHPQGAVEVLLVDEFQDTDPVQSEILEKLAGTKFTAGRLFVVGDFKQSIYRFRGAQPEIFDDFRQRFPSDGHLALTVNFRSMPGILDFVNALFARPFPQPETALTPHEDTLRSDGKPAVEFLWAVEPDDSSPKKPDVESRRKIEARWLARRLKQRLAAGWNVRNRKTKELREANAGDIAFLFRSMTDVAAYESALVEEGLDYHIIGGSAFFVQQEVTDLVNLLSAIEDPFDEVALTGALRSPFFCLSDDALFWLATSRPRGLVSGWSRFESIEELSDVDRRRARRAHALLTSWRDAKDRVPIAALVDRVLDESGYESALLGERLGGRKRANARKLVRLARTFDGQGGFTLADFVARLRADLDEPPREEQAATNDEEGESIRLMSIHQAKGLEFPIVVLPDLDRRRPPGRESVAFHSALGPLVRVSKDQFDRETDDDEAPGKSVGWFAYNAWEKREDEDESIRLFYVATTRARDHLILSAGVDPEEKPHSTALKLLDERFERASGECKAALPDGWGDPLIEVTRESPPEIKGTLRDRKRRPPLRAVAWTIESARVEREPEGRVLPRAPRLVDLATDRGLSPTSARLDRLIRSILADPEARGRRDLPAVAARAARRQEPMAGDSLIATAIDRLGPWLDGPLGRDLAAATAIERAIDWTIAWPFEGPACTVFEGRLDVVFRDKKGEWRIVGVSDADAPESRERLRLRLAAHVATERGLGPIAQGWRLTLGPGGRLIVEDRFDARAIDEAVRAVLEESS